MAHISPLTTLHTKNGARYSEDQGWSLPIHYGDILEEYNAVRSDVGFLDLCHCNLLRFTGADRVPFLQGMVSNDVSVISPGEGTAAAFADVQGKILAEVKILCTVEAFVFELTGVLKNKILSHLSRYLIADDVEITDLSGEYGILSVQGPKSTELLQTLAGTRDLPLKDLDHGEIQLDSVAVRIIRHSHTGEEGFDLWVPANDLMTVAQSLQDGGQPFSARWIGTAAQEILRIEEGIPRYGIDMDEQNLLLETGLDRAVSFDKGCYLGQEIIERIHSRGHVNKRLTGVVWEGKEQAQAGDKLKVKDREVGAVTSSAFSPRLDRPVALAYVQRAYLAPGTRLTLWHDNRMLPAVVASLPFK